MHSGERSAQQHTAMIGSNPAAGGVAGSCTLQSRRLTCALAHIEVWRTGKTANTSCEVAFTIHCRRQLCCLALSSSVRSRSPAVHCANSCSTASDAQPVVRLGTRLIDAMRQCGCLARQVLGALVASVDVLPSKGRYNNFQQLVILYYYPLTFGDTEHTNQRGVHQGG